MTGPTRRPEESVITPLHQTASIHIETIRCALSETRAVQWSVVFDDGSAHNVAREQSAQAGAMPNSDLAVGRNALASQLSIAKEAMLKQFDLFLPFSLRWSPI